MKQLNKQTINYLSYFIKQIPNEALAKETIKQLNNQVVKQTNNK